MAKKRNNSDLVADLTWAELYTAKIRENLRILVPVIKKASADTELTESAALLRQQLGGAHRTAGKLAEILRLELRRSN